VELLTSFVKVVRGMWTEDSQVNKNQKKAGVPHAKGRTAGSSRELVTKKGTLAMVILSSLSSLCLNSIRVWLTSVRILSNYHTGKIWLIVCASRGLSVCFAD
jgi:hypothetical protein